MKRLLFSFIILFHLSFFATTNHFYISQTFFQDQEVLFLSENRGSTVVVLKSSEVFLLDKELEVQSITQLFPTGVINDISCIEAINETTFLFGTNNHSLFLYENGQIISLKELNPELPQKINSIDFRSGNFQEPTTLVATETNVYGSYDLKNYSPYTFDFAQNTHFFGSRNLILLDEYPYCQEVPGEFGMQFTYFSGVSLYRIFDSDTLGFDRLNDVIISKAGSGSDTFNSYAHYGTDQGLYTQHIYSCDNRRIYRHDINFEVFDLEVIEAGLPKTAWFIAGEDGLYFKEETDVVDPTYHKIANISGANAIKYSRFHNHIWVATTSGLVLLSSDDLIRESFEPGTIEYDTVEFCKDEGFFLGVDLNDQLDIQWFRNDTLVDGAISRTLTAYKEGLYSVKYGENEDSMETVPVALVRLDSIFNEKIVEKDYIICPEDNGIRVEFEYHDAWHEYQWYSVERGLEDQFSGGYNNIYVEKAGKYYFKATNCNDFIFISDTVEVIESQLEQPYFENDIRESDFCEGDTLWVSGTDNAVNFYWNNSNENLPYILLTPNMSDDYLYVRTEDIYGCEFDASVKIDDVLEPPYLSEDQLFQYICDTAGYIYFDIAYGSEAIWEGYLNHDYFQVTEGVYPVTVSNGVCPDLQTEVTISEFDPVPYAKGDTLILIGDTLKFPTSDLLPFYLNEHVKISKDRSYLYSTSLISDTIIAEFSFYSPFPSYCVKRYSMEVKFVDQILSLNDLSDFKIFPNPADKEITVTGLKDIRSIYLADPSGRYVLDLKIINKASNRQTIMIPETLKPGIYFLRIEDENSPPFIRKVIIKD